MPRGSETEGAKGAGTPPATGEARLAHRLVARPPGRPTARLARRRGAETRRGQAGHPAPPGGGGRGPPAHGVAGRGGPGPRLPAPGRRLRRVVRGLRRRQHPGQAQGHPADGGGPHLRRRGPGGQGGEDRRPVRQASLLAHRAGRRPRARGLPGPHGQRRAVRRRRPPARSGPAALRLPPVGGHLEPPAGVHQGRVRRPLAGARLEPAVRGLLVPRPPLRADRQRDRPGAALHDGLRHRPDGRGRPAPGRLLDEPRGAHPQLRRGPHPPGLAHRRLGRLLGPPGVGGRADPPGRRGPRGVPLGSDQPGGRQDRAERHRRQRWWPSAIAWTPSGRRAG